MTTEARREEQPKAARRVLAEAKEAAGGQKASVSAILLQLVVILTRLSMQNARELAEVTGAILVTYLLPENHILVQSAKEAGDEFNLWIEESNTAKAKKEMEDTDDEDDKETPASAGHREGETLPMPHVHIAVHCLSALLEDKASCNSKATSAKEDIKKYCKHKISGKEEEEIAAVIKVFRIKRPQKQGKAKGITGRYAKFISAVEPELEAPLKIFLQETGAVEKHGKAPRGYLEREAGRILGLLQKEQKK